MTRSIKSLLDPFFQSKQLDWKIKLLKEWPSIMGSLARYVSIVKIYDDTIILGAQDSCWLQELYLLSSQIITTINQSLDQPRIKQVRFKQVGHITKKNHSSPIIPGKTAPPICLNAREKMALNRIKNENLRSALQSFLIRCYRERIK
jgi:hypothetical protein